MQEFIIPLPYETPRGTRYKVDFTFKDEAGIPVRIQKRGFLSRGEALTFAEREYALMKAGLKIKEKRDRPGPVAKPKTATEAILAIIEWWEKRGTVKPSTASKYRGVARTYIFPAVGQLIWQDLRQSDVAPIMEAAQGLKVPLCLTVLQRAVEDSRKAGIQPPALEIDMRRRNTEPRRRYIDREELLKLCAVSSPKWSAVWRLLFFTGLRVGELMALRWDDWRRDQHAPSLTVSRALCETDRGCILQSPKSGRSRVIPLCREAELALQDLLKAVRGSRGLPGPEDTPKEHLCFPGKTVPFTRSPVVRIALTAACRRAHLEPFGPHCLRHSFASALAKNGVNLQAVCELLGHANISTTQVYSHLSPDGIRQGVNSLDNPTGTPRQRPILS